MINVFKKFLRENYTPYDSKGVCKISIFYIKNVNLKYIYIKINIFEIFLRQNLIQIYTKTHQIAPFEKKLSGCHMPPNPPNTAVTAQGFACMSKFPNLKKNLAPPPRPYQILATPVRATAHFRINNNLYSLYRYT